MSSVGTQEPWEPGDAVPSAGIAEGKLSRDYLEFTVPTRELLVLSYQRMSINPLIMKSRH